MPKPDGSLILLASLTAVLVTRWAARRWDERRRNPLGLPFPPGPKGLPFFGNVFQLPQEFPWLGYKDWSSQYGSELIGVDAMGQPMVVINSFEDAVGLLEKKSGSTSSRPMLPSWRLLGVEWLLSLMPYDSEWRTHRRIFHQHFNENKKLQYGPIVEEEMRGLVSKLLTNPTDFFEASRISFGHLIMRVSYGSKDFGYNHELIKETEEFMQLSTEVAVQGSYLVDAFPVLKYVPSWFPGAGWKRKLEGGATISQRIVNRPFDDTKERIQKSEKSSADTLYPSLAHALIESLPPPDDPGYPEQERIAKNVVGVTYLAGAESSVSTAHALLLALAMYPEVQRKAQEELDGVLNYGSRLPSLSDRDQLPYLQAVLKEVARWHSVAPLGVVHLTNEDMEYKNYFIPKGTILIANSWAMGHDPKYFDNPFGFNPERYLEVGSGKLNPAALELDNVPFGFGRRICPGRHFAKDMVTCFAMSLLATFDVRPPPSTDKEAPLKLEVTSGAVVSNPLPFKYQLSVRSERHASLIRELESV